MKDGVVERADMLHTSLYPMMGGVVSVAELELDGPDVRVERAWMVTDPGHVRMW